MIGGGRDRDMCCKSALVKKKVDTNGKMTRVGRGVGLRTVGAVNMIIYIV